MNTVGFLDRTQEVLDKISQNRYLKSVSRAMVMTIPVVITGSVAVLINNIPFEGYQAFLADSGISTILQLVNRFTVEVLALIVTFYVASNIANSFKTDGQLAGIISLFAYLILTPLSEVEMGENLINFISFEWLGAKGMFVGILVGIIFGRIFALFINKNLYIRMPETVPSFVEKSFASIIPFFALVLLASVLSLLFSMTPSGNAHEIIYNILQVPLQGIGGSIGGIIIAYIAMNIFWWFGIHGKALVFSIVVPIWQASTTENLTASNAGETPPHLMDIGSNTIFFEIGGSAGGIIGLAILFAFFARSDRYKNMGKLGIVPAFFGISEPLIFGTPIVLNPLFIIPIVLAPVVTGLIGYIGLVSGFVPPVTGIQLPTGTPTFVNAFIIAGWQAVVVQFIGVIAAIGIWFPFFKVADKRAIKEEIELGKDNVKGLEDQAVTS